MHMYWFINLLTILIGECKCEDTAGRCIMAARTDGSNPSTNWSSCSSADLKNSVTLKDFSCLYIRYGKGYWIHQNNQIIDYVKINTIILYFYL